MRTLLLPFFALFFSNALLLAGHGLQLALLPLRAESIGFTPTQIGMTGSAYFLGFVLGTLLTPRILRRVGHVRTFAVLGSGFAALMLGVNLASTFPLWLLLRLVIGACISGLYMVIESWLNEQATPGTRSTLLSFYSLLNLLMLTVGQQLLNLGSPGSGVLFSIAAILMALAVIPVSLTTALVPAPVSHVRIDIAKLWALSHVGLMGAMASGLITGAFWALAPVFAQGAELAMSQITLFLSVTILGGAVFQLPIGRISDHYDRRLVMFISALLGAVLSLLIVALAGRSHELLILLAFLWGGCAMTLYAISLAHANDRAEPKDFVMVSSAVLLVYGLSSVVGASSASLLMARVGHQGLFVFAGVCFLIFALAVSLRRREHVLPLHDETEPFQVVAVTSPALFEMDPRTGDAESAASPGMEEDGELHTPSSP